MGYIHFYLTLGNIAPPAEAFVSPNLGRDKVLPDSRIKGAFGAVPTGLFRIEVL